MGIFGNSASPLEAEIGKFLAIIKLQLECYDTDLQFSIIQSIINNISVRNA